MKKRLNTLCFLTTLIAAGGITVPAAAQRLQQTQGRGVVAVKDGTTVTVTWRRLAGEPESATYNLYMRTGDGSFTKVNSEPLVNTNYRTSTSAITTGSEVAVTMVTPQGTESAMSEPYKLKGYDLRNIFVDIDFSNSPLTMSEYTSKFVWPVDLDGDGEMDYVVDRLAIDENETDKVEGYLRTGEHLWTVDMGPNEFICMGQDDQVVAYDINCDGRGEVIIQTSDGTRFWDPENKTWGEYLMGKEDTDGDGLVDYNSQTVRNAPRYMTVVDGLTGRELSTVEQTYTPYYNRTNKAELMGDEYNKHVGHMGVFYPDGVHPAVVMEYHTRTTDGSHHYYNGAWGYTFSGGTAGAWTQLFNEQTGGQTFHQIRIADVDGDGRDEMIEGAYTMDHNGSTLFNTGISHGDRFRTSDIDPEHPGLETFAIQQNAGDMLGQILYDAATGESIKRWYMSAVGDVGRGECIDVDPDHLGYEMWSTMDTYMNDAQGNVIEGLATYFPTEGVWWDGALDRERIDSPDGSGYTPDVRKYDGGKNSRLIEFGKESNYKYKSLNGKRAMFWGDIIGDWREELIFQKWENGVCSGFTGFSTTYATDVDYIYCLQQDPAYRLQCTTRGYYQSPNTGFYLGYDMPRPQLPACMVTDLVCVGTNQFTGFDRGASVVYADGKSVLFDLNTAAEVSVDRTMTPSATYAMTVKDQTVTLGGSGRIAGTGDMWKSQQGRFVLNIPVSTSGTTYISEGTLEVNSTLSGALELRARGTLAGVGMVKSVTVEGALNYEGGRFAPGRSSEVTEVASGAADFAIGTLTIGSSLVLDKRTYCEMDVRTASDNMSADLLHIDGDLTLSAPLIFSIKTAEEQPLPGRYKLVEWTGALNGDVEQCSQRGLSGLSCHFEVADKAIWLVINAQREASNGVFWTGAESGVWDYTTENFSLKDEPTEFVAGDVLMFDDSAERTDVTMNELMPIGQVMVDNSTKDYNFSGEGGFSGSGRFYKRGSGQLTLNCVKSDYTGATYLEGGTVVVSDLADGGQPSVFGAAASSSGLWCLGSSVLEVTGSNVSTDRDLTVTMSGTLRINRGTTSLKGIVTGPGYLTKEGAGQLNFTYGGANTWESGLWLKEGTIAMGCWNTTFGLGAIRVTQGTLRMFDHNSTSAVPVLNQTIKLDDDGELTVVAGSRCKVQGAWSGKGTVTISFPYVRGDFSTDLSSFEGTLKVTSGQLRLTAATNMKQGALELGAGVYMAHYKSQSGTEQSLTTTLGALRSSASDCTVGQGTFNVGYLGTDDTFAGSFTNSTSKVNKYGEGVWTLTGKSSAPLNVYKGTVALNNTADATIGTTSVYDGATLIGNGYGSSVAVYSGGAIGFGQTPTATGIGKLKLTGSLTVRAGGTLHIKCRKASYVRNDGFEVGDFVSLESPKFEVDFVTGTYVDGDSLQVFTGFTKFLMSGTPTFEPETPAPGFHWDYSTLTTDGCLRIAANTDAIDRITTDGEAATNNDTYDLTGRKVENPKAHGVYIRSGKKVVK